MDSIIGSALEEICAKGQSGLSLASLWPRIAPSLSSSNLDLSPAVKNSVWNNLLNVPTLQFHANGLRYSAQHPSIRSFQDAEKLNLIIVAEEHLRDNFVGIYDQASAHGSISSNQRRVLERLAIARANGVTQSELSKEFGIEGNNMFYVTKNLECRGLIVRPDAIVRTKEAGEEGDFKNNASIASTKLLYLYRYAQHLSSQQRLEIIREEQTLDSLGNGYESDAGKDDFAQGGVKDDVCVKDYLPQMKAVCDKLEDANGKVLVVSDIKQDLGYIGSCAGHRAWRNICNRLRHAHIVEEFEAKVNDKAERCLRLVKKFSSNFDLKSFASADEKFDGNPLLSFGRNQRTDQLVDLSIEHQVYDMIDAEGSHGILGRELASRLGVSHKRNQARLENMSSRFGAVMQAETVKKSKAYRFWTHGNLNRQSSAVHPLKTKSLDVIKISNVNDENKDASDTSTNYLLECHPSTSKGDFPTLEKIDQTEVKIAIPHIHDDGTANNELLCSGNPQELLTERTGTSTVPDSEIDIFSTEIEMQASPSERTPPTSVKPRKSRSSQRYPCQSTIDSTRRELRILERLKDEKFILKAELYRWLVNFEMDKGTTMDRKTIKRIVSKLQQEGHCKYIKINVPVVSNCGGSRIIDVILHPSVQSLLPELHGEIHDRLRSFEMQSRGHGSTKWKNNESLPVLSNIKRTTSRVYSDSQAVRSEAMRANGFVFPKMVRTKLLHSFLWSYLSSSPGSDDALLSGKDLNDLKNHITACNLFSLEEAIKAIPLELFLQVAGSTKKIDDIAEKCKRGLRLSDLPVHDYKHLMDTTATGRLSKIVDILRRLKLIRLVTNGHSDDGVKVPHTTFTHAFELKPYIEEPQSFVSTFSNSKSLDLRPHIRHDFILSSKKAVDEYWKTLEFCYAAIDPRTALHAFPGSSVHEVFVSRSWALVQAMTADQRVELLRLIDKVNLDKKFTFKECEKIAKDLNLTIEQVLRVYYDKRQKRINRFQGALTTSGDDPRLVKGNHASSSRKRKRSVNARMLKRTNVDPQAAELSDNVNDFREHNPSIPLSVVHDVHLGACQEDHLETVPEPDHNEDEECRSIINMHALKRTRQKRFTWTDEADRQLLIQYVRNRVTLGPQFQRMDWTSIPDLPGLPNTCRKRMSLLNSNSKFRRAVMKLCNVLSERYVNYLERDQNRSVRMADQREFIGSSSGKCHNKCFSDGVQHTQESELKEEHWDDFDDTNIKMVLDEVLWHKQMAKLECSKRIGSFSDWSDQNIHSKEDFQESDLVSLSTPTDDIPDHAEEPKDYAEKSRSHRLNQKFIERLNEGTNSLAIASAVELLKLVFLSTSALPEVPNLLAETLRRYSEHDLFTAFSYLREKKFMVGGDDKPFVLSQHFLQRVSTSPFPTKTGERAAKFSSWLHEREKDLIEGTIDLTADLQCGDIFHLFALVSLDELSLCPCLPDEGVGEAEYLKGQKRRSDNNEYYDCNKAKKLKSLNDAELISRREKGFPGIMVSVNRTAFSIANVVDFFKDREPSATDLLIDWNDKPNTILGGNFCSTVSCDDLIDIPGVQNVVPLTESSSQSLWEIMTSFAERLMLKPQQRVSPLYPELFQAVYTSIQKAGDQGLSIGEVLNVPGETIPDLVIDVLQAFGRALKVNAHDSVRVVDGLYRSKYLLTTNTGFSHGHEPPSILKTAKSADDDCLTEQPEDHDTSTASPEIGSLNVDTVHKVTILNLPEGAPAPLSEIPSSVVQDGCMLDIFAVPKGDKPHKSSFVDMPMLPWMNIDGTVNKSVFKGLTRRVLGIVMQNPGILEGDIICRMDVLNPQSCRTLLNLMILDKHLMRRKMLQSVHCGPPSLLGALSGNFRKQKFICRQHYFANPMSTSLL